MSLPRSDLENVHGHHAIHHCSEQSWDELFLSATLNPEHDVRRFSQAPMKEKHLCSDLILLMRELEKHFPELYSHMTSHPLYLYIYASAEDARLLDVCENVCRSCDFPKALVADLYELVRRVDAEISCRRVYCLRQYKEIIAKLVVNPCAQLVVVRKSPCDAAAPSTDGMLYKRYFHYRGIVGIPALGAVDASTDTYVKGFSQSIGVSMIAPVDLQRYYYLVHLLRDSEPSSSNLQKNAAMLAKITATRRRAYRRPWNCSAALLQPRLRQSQSIAAADARTSSPARRRRRGVQILLRSRTCATD